MLGSYRISSGLLFCILLLKQAKGLQINLYRVPLPLDSSLLDVELPRFDGHLSA